MESITIFAILIAPPLLFDKLFVNVDEDISSMFDITDPNIYPPPFCA